MPTVCVFYGIYIRMYYDDHIPAHFHVYYGDNAAKVTIQTGEIIAGRLPNRVLALVREWSDINKPALLDNWRRCLHHEPLLMLDPLE